MAINRLGHFVELLVGEPKDIIHENSLVELTDISVI